MYWLCPADGHVVNRRVVTGRVLPEEDNCPRHGVPLFQKCRRCGTLWPLTVRAFYGRDPDAGHDFCGKCAMPAPWLSPYDLMEWIRNNLKASPDLKTEDRHRLLVM